MKPIAQPTKARRLYKPVILRRTNRQPKLAKRPIPEHTFLKYFRLVRAWLRITCKITLSDFEMLCYLHSFVLFTDKHISEFQEIMSFNKKKRKELLDRGLIVYYRKPQPGNVAIYELSAHSKTMMEKTYKRMLGLEPVEDFVTENQLRNKSRSRFSLRQYTRAARRMQKDLQDYKDVSL